jgi:ABC-type antimicrobial peptide transport system permease subunit
MLYVRSVVSPDTVLGDIRRQLYAVEPRLPFARVVTMREQLSDSLWEDRLLAGLSLSFALISAAMAATGLYGLLSYDAAQRTRDYSIRIAVGAQKGDIAALFVKRLTKIILAGAAIGTIACILLARIVVAALYGVHPLDPWSISGAFVIVSLIGMLASWEPIRRATNVQVTEVLRYE